MFDLNAKEKLLYTFVLDYYKAEKRNPTHSELVEFANNLNKSILKLSEDSVNKVICYYEHKIGVRAYKGTSLHDKTTDNKWFFEIKNNPEYKFEYWERYERYLELDKDFDIDTIRVLKELTEETLSFCSNPNLPDGTICRRKGLVVGDVQSGKTANYLGLINLAVDYGYKLIVVLAGLTDSLRKQTQERLDEGFLGIVSNTLEKSEVEYKGVGLLENKRYAVSLTNIDTDFKKDCLRFMHATSSDYNKPIVVVVKKNKSTLQNLAKYLKPGTAGVINHILIIDDEADNASVNTKKDDETPSTINALIRDLYNNFPIATYVGYTATPYANVFINPDDEKSYEDLFPSNFITLLETPTSYFGGKKVFGEKYHGNTKHIRLLDEEEYNFLDTNHKKDVDYPALADSLKEAIQCFLINSVIYTLLGKIKKHRTMMINISRFNNVQSKIKYNVVEYIKQLKNVIEQESFMPDEYFLRNKDMRDMYNMFIASDFYLDLREKITWAKIKENLLSEINKIQVLVVNGKKTDDKLDYDGLKEKGARYIVIGGFVLSRGLTLEGLMVSYYSRNGFAYDTLLQMCRWFGYRPGYESLCRIYMSQQNVENFGAVLEATDDLKAQFKKMTEADKTPNTFGLMVKKSPDILNTLLVTSRNKSRHSVDREFTLNYSGAAISTSKLYISKTKNDINLSTLDVIKNSNLQIEIVNKRFMIRNVDKNIISEIIGKIDIPLINTKFDTLTLNDYIKSEESYRLWDIVFATGNDHDCKPFKFDNNVVFPAPKRKFYYNKDENFIRIAGNNNNLIDPGIFNSGLDLATIEEIKESLPKGKTPSSKDYLRFRKQPLLIIYLIDLKNEDNNVDKANIINNLGNDFLIGFGIGFPDNGNEIVLKYKLNKRKEEEFVKEREKTEDDDNE